MSQHVLCQPTLLDKGHFTPRMRTNMRLLSRMFLHVVEHSALGRMGCGYKGTLGTGEGSITITDVFHRTWALRWPGQVKFS